MNEGGSIISLDLQNMIKEYIQLSDVNEVF